MNPSLPANRFYGDFDCEHLPGSRPEDDHRGPFQIDRDRVLFSSAFRQLQSKTQVFQSGEYDFYRTRLTHTIEVARIARSIAEFLNQTSDRLRPDFYIDPDLVEAVGLAHDLGHPPFGHIGERKLNQLMAPQGGFEGNAQTLRILTRLIYSRRDRLSGMKPTRAFLDGVLKYKSLHKELVSTDADGTTRYPYHHFLYDEQDPLRTFVFPDLSLEERSLHQREAFKSIECQIMDWADDTAYSLHDIVDGIKAGFITPDSLTEWSTRQPGLSSFQMQTLEELIAEIRAGGYEPRTSQWIGQFIQACRLEPADSPMAAHTNRHRFRLTVEPRVREVCELHKAIAIDLIFKSSPLQQIEFKGGRLLDQLFAAYRSHVLDAAEPSLRLLPDPLHGWIQREDSTRGRWRLLCDHLASLTDGQAIRTYKRLFEPEFGALMDLY